MRVGLIIYGSLDTISGGYIYDKNLVEYLQSKGIFVKIFSQKSSNFFSRFKNNFSRKFIKDILEFSPDILLEDEMNFVSLFLLNKKLKNKAKFPIISIVHLLYQHIRGDYLAKLLMNKIELSYLKSVNGFICTSLSTRTSLMNVIGEKHNSVIAHPGKDRYQFDIEKSQIALKCACKELRIIFIANLIPRKGLHYLLEALSKIENQFWRLSVIEGNHSDLEYSDKILKMIIDLRLTNNVKLLGTLDAKNLKNQLISHHVLAVPSYYESFGMVYAEAMGAGLPVIACKSGGAQEIVKDCVNGFLIRPDDTQMLRESISKLITNRKLLAKMSLSSLAAYENMASWDQTMEKVHRFLCLHIANYHNG